jgi:uncharacterized membrane protein
MVNPAIAVPAVGALVFRAWSRKTLTPAGIVAALTTAIVHVLHPWILPFLLLAVFYLGGSQATKVRMHILNGAFPRTRVVPDFELCFPG